MANLPATLRLVRDVEIAYISATLEQFRDVNITGDSATSRLVRTVEIHDIVEIIRKGLIFDENVLKTAKEKTESDISDIKSKIHRFPAKLRGFGGRDEDYIKPTVVAIGPYYRRLPELQAMEEVKRMATYYFCEGLDDSAEEVYKKIFPVACNVRGCYADADALKGIIDHDFAAMMFFDGCFLVQCMVSLHSKEKSLMTEVISSKCLSSLKRDIMLLENQIPWPVIKILMALRPATSIGDFIGGFISGFHDTLRHRSVSINHDNEPPHLLGLIHFYQVHSSFVGEESGSSEIAKKSYKQEVKELTVTTSAAELAEIGVKLTSSRTTQFSDMKVESGLVRGKLFLAPLHLHDVTACWLVNMAAYEQCTGKVREFDYPVNSYLTVLAQLMYQDDDVRELHSKGIVLTTGFDYHRTLKFFNCLSQHYSYFAVFQGLQEHKQKRCVCIAIHKFLYHYGKTIAKVLSILGVLMGIFKALLSVKQHQP